MKNENTKTATFHMRTTQSEKIKIAMLAKRYGCKESEAVRRAIRHTLATMPKTAKVMQ